MKKIVLILSFSVSLLFLNSNTARAFDGFYTLENQNIEFRLARNLDNIFKREETWPIEKDINGNKVYLSDQVLINQDDIEGILIKKHSEDEESATWVINGEIHKMTKYSQEIPYEVRFIFKKNSWEKIRQLTGKYFWDHYDTAIVKQTTILQTPRITKIDKEATLALNIKAVKLLVKGLKQGKEPSLEERDIEYENWLIQNLKTDPTYRWDLDSIASGYLQKENYQKTLELFNIMVNNDPSFGDGYFKIGYCYYKQRNYDNALSFFEKCLSLNPDIQGELTLELFIADCYIGKEQYDTALDKLRLCLEKVKKYELPVNNEFIQMIEKRIKSLEEKIGLPTNVS